MPIETGPGQEFQFDWSDCKDWGKLWGLGELHCFGCILCWSRRRLWWFTNSLDRSHTLEGLVRFFEDIGGIPGLGRTDRMGALGHTRGNIFRFAPEVLEFARYHGCALKACKSRDAKRKGKVERPFWELKKAFFQELVVLGPPSSIDELNRRCPVSSTASVYETIKDGLGYLKLNRAAECFAPLIEQAREQDWDHLEFLSRLVGEEVTSTRNRRLSARLRFAHFPTQRTLETFDFDFQPSIDRKLINDLTSLRFIPEGRPVLFLGQPGCGKTHLAIALATLAVEAGYRAYFTSAADMCSSIAAAYADGSFRTRMRTYTGPSVLVIDDVGWFRWTALPAMPFTRWSTAATTSGLLPSSRPTEACLPGPRCLVIRSWRWPSWTG